MRIINSVFEWFESWIDPFVQRADYEPPNRLPGYVWHYVSQAKWAFLALLLYGFAQAIVEAMIFSFIGETIDILGSFQQTAGQSGWPELWGTHGDALIYMVITIVIARTAVILFGALVEGQVVVAGFFTLMRWQSHKHVVSQSLSFFQNDLAGRVSQKVFQSGKATGDMLISLLQVMWFITVYSVTTAALLSALNWQLGLMIVVWLAIYAVVAVLYVPKIRDHGRLTAEAASVASGRMVDTYSNIQTVKLHDSQSLRDDWVYEGMLGMYGAAKRFTRALTGFRSILAAISGIAIVAVGWLAIDIWLARIISLGEVAFVLALVLRLNLLLNRLMGQLNGFFRDVGTTQNTMELIAQPLGLRDQLDAKPLRFKHGLIEIVNMGFTHDAAKPVFEAFDLTIKPGEKIGLVGPSGAGKTTLINLLLRFFDVNVGKICVDGQDISQVTQQSLRSHFALVQQEAGLFHRSVHDNISYGKPEATRQQVIAAAKQANADAFIDDLVDQKGRTGYDAQVGERGVKLSGGQRQRIAIARIFLRDAPILILDEATSQLDSETEEAIQENLAHLIENKTTIAIAHRLSTISKMDRLVIIDQGKIVDMGTHKELLSRGGLYADLWARQAGGFIGAS